MVQIDPGQPGHQAPTPPAPQHLTGGPRDVAGAQRGVQHLLDGADPALAPVVLDEVGELIEPVQQPIVEAEQHLGPLGEAATDPADLRRAGAAGGQGDVLGGRGGQVRHHVCYQR